MVKEMFKQPSYLTVPELLLRWGKRAGAEREHSQVQVDQRPEGGEGQGPAAVRGR